jgi:hypothetical protein
MTKYLFDDQSIEIPCPRCHQTAPKLLTGYGPMTATPVRGATPRLWSTKTRCLLNDQSYLERERKQKPAGVNRRAHLSSSG